MKHILVSTDFSPESTLAFDAAKKQAELCGKETCKLTLLTVLEELAPTSVQFEFALALIDTKGMIENAVEQAKEKISELKLKYFEGFPVEAVVQRATKAVHAEILDYSDEHDVDLIVLATHGRTGFSHLLIGSVSEKIVRQAHCPVLVVPAHP